MDDQEFRVYPLADWIRLSRAGVVQTCLQRGRYGTGNGQRGKRWYRMKIHLRHGYPSFNVRDRTGHAAAHSLHRALGLTWLDPPLDPACTCVLHKDDNKMNWSLDNLYWGTDLDNSRDAWRNGRLKSGGENHQAKLSNEQRAQAKKDYELGVRIVVLARQHGISTAGMSFIVRGRNGAVGDNRKKHGAAHHNAKFSDEQRAKIRTAYASGQTQRGIARQFNVSPTCIRYIVNGRKDRTGKCLAN